MGDLPVFRDMKKTAAKLDEEFKKTKLNVKSALIEYGIERNAEAAYSTYDACYTECKKEYDMVKNNLLEFNAQLDTSIDKQEQFLEMNNALCCSLEEELEELEMHLKIFNYEPLKVQENKKESASKEKDHIEDSTQENVVKVAEAIVSQKGDTPSIIEEKIPSTSVPYTDATPVLELVQCSIREKDVEVESSTPKLNLEISKRESEITRIEVKTPESCTPVLDPNRHGRRKKNKFVEIKRKLNFVDDM